jgi:ATP-dependent Clp protease ATP-binding subunit ClpA
MKRPVVFPYTTDLFDEADKAQFDVFDCLSQIFGKGRLTDGKSKTTESKGAIPIMTSSIASNDIAKFAL